MHFRRERRNGVVVSLQETLEAGKEDSALTLSDVLQDGFCMEDACERQDEARRLRRLIEGLPARERKLILLRYGLAGQPPLTQLETLPTTVLEYSYKNDDLGDPLINDYHALAMQLCTREELDQIASYAFKINEILKAFFKEINVDLVDFKLEFGKLSDGTIVLADEISPDTCRFWDATTHEKLDKDRFRRDMDNVDEGYHEIMKRLLGE